MQRFIAYLSLEEWLKFFSVFPSWNFTFPDVIVLSEDCSTTLMCLLERKLNCQIRTLELKGPGPTSAGGALGILHKCLALEGQAFSCLVHLDLSAQMQPIDYFLQLFHGRISAFPLLRFLSARLTDPDRSDQLIDEVTAPPLLDEVKLFLVSYISEEDPFLPQLLRLLRNIAVLTVCEGMVDCVPWLHFIGSPELRDTLCRLQYLSVDAGSELLEVVHNMPFVERNVRFPALREVYVPTTCISYDRALLENGLISDCQKIACRVLCGLKFQKRLNKMNKLCLEDRIAHLERLRIANQKNIDFLETLWRTNREPAIAQNTENREECSSSGEYRHNKIVELKNEPQKNLAFDVENICGSDSNAEEVDEQISSYFREPTQACLRFSCQTLHEYNEQKKQRAEEEAIIAGGYAIELFLECYLLILFYGDEAITYLPDQ
nr:unnamed protein product [Spirometra erinaceieuropaei]